MKELVVISGKGGTGKTSITASLAALAGNAVLADCDVDAADLHLLLEPRVEKTNAFISGKEAHIRVDDCVMCGQCVDICRFNAIEERTGEDGHACYQVNPLACEGCGVCTEVCAMDAIDFLPRHCGEWFVSNTRFGEMVHARLGIAAENSGKLVSVVRQHAKQLANEKQRGLIIVDGPPGIGCPVIASVSGATAVLVVCEPTLSGKHDLQRVLDLAKHFQVPAYVCINKADLNEQISGEIQTLAKEYHAQTLGEIGFDDVVTEAQLAGQTVIEYAPQSMAADQLRQIWTRLEDCLQDRVAAGN